MAREIDATTDAPHADAATERDLIREVIADTDIHCLLWHGDEQHVALVQRDKAPSTEYPMRDERVVLVEWAEEDWALSVAVASGIGTQWEMEQELAEISEDRERIPDIAAELFAGGDN
jgi:hypothetical protein